VLVIVSFNCEPWCVEPCESLNGDLENECTGCTSAEHRCYPGAMGYSLADARTVPAQTCQEADELSEPWRVWEDDDVAWATTHASSNVELPCTIAEYRDIASGVAAQLTNGSHPFFVRMAEHPIDVTGQSFWGSPAEALNEVLTKYGDATDFYNVMNPDDNQLCSRQDVSVSSRVEARAALVGVLLDAEDSERWASVMRHTAGALGGWEYGDDTRGKQSSQAAIIVGRRASGVSNDTHDPSWFFHIFGRKVWGFAREFQDAWGSRAGVCTDGLLELPHVCMATAGTLLFAPSGWYHNTCHLDEASMSLIQWRAER
jgi:hypothetical protein